MNKYGLIEVNKIHINNSYLLIGENFQKLLLWKPRIGEAVTVSAPPDKYFRARVVKLERDSAEILIFEEICGTVEPYTSITLLQALPEKERMELIIQKTTELGVNSIIPFKSKRSIAIEARDKSQKKSHKWGDIALRAAKQARRATIPTIYCYCSFNDALSLVSKSQLKLMFWENEKKVHLRHAIKDIKAIKHIAIMIGPEGGFDETEMEDAKKIGFVPISLGERILRTETASIIAVGLIQYEFGDIG